MFHNMESQRIHPLMVWNKNRRFRHVTGASRCRINKSRSDCTRRMFSGCKKCVGSDWCQVLPKIKFEIVVSSQEWEKKTVEAIQKAAFTGNHGDGKIFSYNIRQAMKIRTQETGYDAVQSPEDE